MVQYFEDPQGQCMMVYNGLPRELPFVRLHSACVFSESLGGSDCDCGLQLDASLAQVAREGGVVVYSWEEGRGLGISKKIAAIQLQQTEGIDTRTAFERLGYAPDPRTHNVAAAALKALGVGPRIRLATRNPGKIVALEAAGFAVDRTSLTLSMSETVKAYVDQKRACLGHYDDD
jgi:GTP cyclohydrolase II